MAEQFNTEIKELFREFKELPSGFKSKLHITELQSKMVAGMRTEPEYAITVLGDLVWQARAEIAKRDADFFLTRRYEVDLTRLCKEHDVCYDDAINTVNFMKDAYRQAADDVKTRVMDRLQTLLKIIAARELAKRPAKK
jgi:hypothetical protein